MKTVSFYGTCSARSTLVLVSQRITHEYEVKKIRASFANGCFNQVRLEFLVAPDDHAPSSGSPSGVSMLDDYGQVKFVVGNDEDVVMEHSLVVDYGGSFLKVYADNRAYTDEDVVVQMTIEDVERRA